MLARLTASRGAQRAIHLCELIASVQFAQIPSIALADLISRIVSDSGESTYRVILHSLLRGGGSGAVGEIAALSSIAAALKPRTILEFGTYDGCTTWHLLANAAAECRITTIDLPLGTQVIGSTDEALQGTSHRPFLPNDPRVRLVEIDSRNWTPDMHDVDLCFIDAGHSLECVRSDTEKALPLMRPGGLIAWHDATWQRDGYGVNRYLRGLRDCGHEVFLVDVGPYDYSGLAVCWLSPRAQSCA